MKPGGICILAFACPCQSTVTSAVLALVEALRTVTYYLPFNFSLSVVVRVQIWEFRIALNKITQTVSLTTIVSKMAYGFSSKAIFCSLSQWLRPLLPLMCLENSYK